MGLKIILDAVKSSGGISKSAGSAGSSGSAPQYDDSTTWGNSTWSTGSTWQGWNTKLAVINYDDANIRIVKQKRTVETDRYVLLVNQYMLFCDGYVN